MALPPYSYSNKNNHELPIEQGRSAKKAKNNSTEKADEQINKVEKIKRKAIEQESNGEPPQKKLLATAATLAVAGSVVVGAVGLWKLMAHKNTRKHVLYAESSQQEIDYGKVFSNYDKTSRKEKVAFLSNMEQIIPQLSFEQIQTFLSDIPPALRREAMIKNLAFHALSQVCRQRKDDSNLLDFLDEVKKSCPEFIEDDARIFCSRIYSSSEASLPYELYHKLMVSNLAPNMAQELLRVFLSSPSSIDVHTPLIERLVKTAGISPYALLEERNFQAANDLFLRELILLCPNEKREQAVKNCILAFCRNSQFQRADNIVKALLPNLEKQRHPSSMFSSLYTKLKYVCQYGSWYCFHYDPDLRFEGAEQATFKNYVNSQNFEKAKDLFSGETLHLVTDNIQKAKEAAAILKKDDEKALSDEVQWLYEKRLPTSFASCEGFVSFLQKTKLHSLCKFYNHPLVQNHQGNIPIIKVQGQFVPFPEFIQRFTLEQGKADMQVIEKSTGHRWSYLEEGFAPHDPEKEIRPFKTIDRSNEENPSYQITFNYISEGHTNSLSGIKRLREHMWLNLCTPDGKLYSAGSLSASVIRSPDLYEYLPFNKKTVTFPISKSEFDKLLREIRKKQRQEESSFNFASQNCSTFCAQTARIVLPNISPKTELGAFNTFESRIKAFVISRELAEKVYHNRTTISQALVVHRVGGAGLGAVILLNRLKSLVGEDVTYREFVSIFSILAQDERFLQNFDRISNQFQSSLMQDSKEEMQSKLFNLISDIFEASKDITIDTPAVLFSQLETLKAREK